MRVVTRSKVKVIGSEAMTCIRRHAASSFCIDDLADLKKFQLEEEDHPTTTTSSSETGAGLDGVLSAVDARPFQEVPGPRGLPLIGNMLSYSKLGMSVNRVGFLR